MKRIINNSLLSFFTLCLISLLLTACILPLNPDDPDIDDFDTLTIADIEEILRAQIPSVASEKIHLTHYVDNSSAHISWSSVPSLITHEGFISKGIGDTNVVLTALVKLKGKEYTIDFNVIVRGIELKPLKQSKMIIAYFYDYKYFDIPDNMLEQLDYINYSFATIDVNTHKLKLSLSHLEKVLAYREKGVRVGLAIGGWGADGFSQGVATSATRSILIESIMDTIKKYNFDGIDLDWEYPNRGFEGMAYSANDKANLTLFAKELSAEMKAYRSDLVLSMAVIASSNTLYDIRGMEPYLDYFNLMTYDGGSGTSANHHTSLYSIVSNSVSFYKNAGVPTNKIIIGAAFYGHKKTITSLKTGILNSTTVASGTVDYTTIVNNYLNNPSFTQYFDEQAKAPYLCDGTTFISYDDPVSLNLKAQYALDNNLAGVMFWELGSDKTGILLNAIYQAMK